MIKIACQTILYGNPTIKDNIENILKNVHENGYDGVEVGARHFYMDRSAYYINLLAQNNLEIPAIHIGGDFLNRDSVSDQIASIDNTIVFANKLGCKYIYLSGCYRKDKTAEDYLYEAHVYNEIGKHCCAAGLMLCYHNHDWEFADNAMGMKILLQKITAENMKLVPDVGWITIGGADPVEFLKVNAERIEALHFKDFLRPKQFTEIGTGIVNFKGVYEFFKTIKENSWITAEQDQTSRTPEESSKANYEFISKMVK